MYDYHQDYSLSLPVKNPKKATLCGIVATRIAKNRLVNNYLIEKYLTRSLSNLVVGCKAIIYLDIEGRLESILSGKCTSGF